MNKFKKTDNINKFHKSYTIRLFFFFHRFSFLALFQLQKHYQWDPSLDALRLHDVIIMMLVNGRIIAND